MDILLIALKSGLSTFLGVRYAASPAGGFQPVISTKSIGFTYFYIRCIALASSIATGSSGGGSVRD
jgi:hypothetical protein